MKIKDIVTNWLIETDLFEMAFQRKIVINKVRSLQLQISKHLIKCLYYNVPDTTKEHWYKEINTWLSDIDEYRLKNNKTLNGSVYYKLLFREPLGERTDVTRKIKKINTDKTMSYRQGLISIDKLHENIEKVLHQVSYDLSNNKLKGIEEYLEELDS